MAFARLGITSIYFHRSCDSTVQQIHAKHLFMNIVNRDRLFSIGLKHSSDIHFVMMEPVAERGKNPRILRSIAKCHHALTLSTVERLQGIITTRCEGQAIVKVVRVNMTEGPWITCGNIRRPIHRVCVITELRSVRREPIKTHRARLTWQPNIGRR